MVERRVQSYVLSSHIGPMVGPDFRTVLSSAYVTSLISSSGLGILDMKRLNSVGDKIPPCGNPCLIVQSLDLAPLKVTGKEAFQVAVQWQFNNVVEESFRNGERNSIKGLAEVDCHQDCAIMWL